LFSARPSNHCFVPGSCSDPPLPPPPAPFALLCSQPASVQPLHFPVLPSAPASCSSFFSNHHPASIHPDLCSPPQCSLSISCPIGLHCRLASVPGVTPGLVPCLLRRVSAAPCTLRCYFSSPCCSLPPHRRQSPMLPPARFRILQPSAPCLHTDSVLDPCPIIPPCPPLCPAVPLLCPGNGRCIPHLSCFPA